MRGYSAPVSSSDSTVHNRASCSTLHAISLSLSLSLPHTHTLSLSLSLSSTHPFSLAHTLSYTHTHTLSLTHTHTHSLSCTHTHTLSCTHTRRDGTPWPSSTFATAVLISWPSDLETLLSTNNHAHVGGNDDGECGRRVGYAVQN